MKKITIYKALFLMLCFVISFNGVKAQSWEEVAITDLTSSDIFLIVDTTSSKALTSANGTASAPTAVSVTFNETKTAIIGDIPDDLKWNIGGDALGYIFYPNGTTTTWLYCTNTNNGVRVGTNVSKTFVLDSNWLQHLGTSRFMGVYITNPDWRCYTAYTQANIAQTVTKFYKYVNNSTIATPTFSVSSGNYFEPQEVTITCTTPNTTILYTTDGSTPNSLSQVYSLPILLNTTTVLKAIACNENDTSYVSTATYTFPIDVANIAELRQGETGNTLYRLTGEAIITMQSSVRNAKYIQDGTAGILIDDNGGIITTLYSQGDGITGIVGTLNLYNGMLQFLPALDAGAATSHNNEIVPISVSLPEAGNYPAQVIRINNVLIEGIGDFVAATNYNLNGGNNPVLRTHYTDLDYIGTPIPAQAQDITGVVLLYNTTVQIIPRSLTDFTPSLVTCSMPPTLNPCTVSDITYHGLTISSSIGEIGEACACLEYGFVYSATNPFPSLTEADCEIVEMGNSIEANVPFQQDLSLSANTTYYFSSYAINGFDTAYSVVEPATTLMPNNYEISFVVNGSVTAVAPITYTEGEAPITLPSIDGCGDYDFVGWTSTPTNLTAEAPAFISQLSATSDTVLYALFSKTDLNLTTTDSIEITRSNFEEGALAYNMDDLWEAISTNRQDTLYGLMDLYSNTTQTTLQCRPDRGTLPYNITPVPGAITRIDIVGGQTGTPRYWTPYLSASDSLSKSTFLSEGTELAEQVGVDNAATISWEIAPEQQFRFFYLNMTGGASYLNSIKIVYNCGTINYTTNATDSILFYASICEGETYLLNGFNENSNGTYYQDVTENDYCHYTNVLFLTVVTADTTDIYDAICQGESYLANGFDISETETQVPGIIYQTHSLNNVAGCDSIVTLNLTIKSATTGIDVQSACESYTWIDGNTYTASTNTPTFTLINADGCDSIVTLNLTIKSATTAIDVQSACESYTWIDGNTYTESTNTPTFTLINADGCDSIVTLNLTIKSATTAIDVQSACESYTWIDGNTYTESTNTPTFTLINADGCDSTITLHLTIHRTSETIDYQTHFDSFTWIDGVTYTESTNTPTFTLQDANGCDSVITLHLTINISVPGVDYVTSCDSFVWMDGITYYESTNTPTWTIDEDSVITLNLTINHSTIGTDVQSACESYTWIDGNTYTASTNTPTFTLTNAAGCDSVVTLHLTINNSTIGTDVQTACESYTWIDGNTYTASTDTPTFTLTNAAGCDSVVTLDLTINHSTIGTDVQTACESYTWINGNTYTASTNTPTFTLTNAAGCDSVVTLDLTINHSTIGTDVQTACESYTWIDGNTYTASTNTPTFTLTNAAGCDSVVTLDLTINHSTIATDVQSACDSYTWIDGNTYTASTNTPTFTLTNAAGCDSVVTLHLTINHSTIGTDVQTACESYTWIDGNTYTASTDTPTFTLTNTAGCDSVVTLDLTINHSTIGTDVQTACESYTWIDGNTYTASTNTPTFTLTNAAGCDSLVTLNLTINHSTIGTDVQSACDSYTWIDGNTYTASTNTPTFTLTNAAGCDSLVTLNLTINHSTIGTDVQSACESYTWIDGNTYTASTNTPTFTLTNAAGCDSLVTLHLTINHSTIGTDVQSACDSYTWIDGNTYTASTNTPTFTLTNAAGCDSLVTLHLTINHSTIGTDVQSACDSYTWIDGNTYTASTNTPTFTLTNAAGCDSVVTLDLTINHSTIATDVQSACDSYTWIDGNNYTASTNTPTFTLTNAAGCDSVVTLDLTIYENPDAVITGDSAVFSGEAATLIASEGSSYEWSTGDTTQSITVYPADTTTYYVIVSNEFGCSDTAYFTINVINSVEDNVLIYCNIYPNPADHLVTIEAENMQLIRVVSISGQLIDLYSMSGNIYYLNTEDYAPGVYLIDIITTDERIISRKIIVRH